MCGPIVDAPSLPSVGVTKPVSNTQKRNSTRVFRDTITGVLYLASNKGDISAVSASGTDLNESLVFTSLEAVLVDSDLVELSVPPVQVDALIAAQGATGFTLGDIVRNMETGEYGKVVGFGTINEEQDRVLLVEIAGDAGGQDIVAVNPSSVDFAGKLQA